VEQGLRYPVLQQRDPSATRHFLLVKLQDGDQDGEWHLFLNGNIQTDAIYPGHSFVGSFGVSEIESNCDSAWAEIDGLQETSRGAPETWPAMECRLDNIEDFHLDIASATHKFVRPDQTASGCAGTT